MRFTSNVAPTLTPLGYKLLSISERKLSKLEPEIGGKDEGSLLHKGVLVRQAIKSAWNSINDYSSSSKATEINDWRSNSAMGLDVIGEDDEEEEEDIQGEEEDETKQEKWFEDLVSSFGEDDLEDDAHSTSSSYHRHDWVESHVSSGYTSATEFEDLEYQPTELQIFSLPSPSFSPAQTSVTLPAFEPTSPTSPTSSISSIESSTESMIDSFSSIATTVDIVEVEVEDEVDFDDTMSECSECNSDVSSLVIDEVVPTSTRGFRRFYNEPSTPFLSASPSPQVQYRFDSSPPFMDTILDVGEDSTSDELDCDILELPPLLHRCPSDCSVSSLEQEECQTPPSGSCEDLEVSVELEDRGDDIWECESEVRVNRLDRVINELEYDWEFGEREHLKNGHVNMRGRSLGLGLDLGIDF